jgi:hypothetical protein
MDALLQESPLNAADESEEAVPVPPR